MRSLTVPLRWLVAASLMGLASCSWGESREIEVTRSPESEPCLELFDAELLEAVTGVPLGSLSMTGVVGFEPRLGTSCSFLIEQRYVVHARVQYEDEHAEQPSRPWTVLSGESARDIGGWVGYTGVVSRGELPAKRIAVAWERLPWLEERSGFTVIEVSLYPIVEDRDPDADVERLAEQLIEVVEDWSEAYLAGEHERPPSVEALGR